MREKNITQLEKIKSMMMVNERSVKEYISIGADVVHYLNSILFAQFMLNMHGLHNLERPAVLITHKIWLKHLKPKLLINESR